MKYVFPKNFEVEDRVMTKSYNLFQIPSQAIYFLAHNKIMVHSKNETNLANKRDRQIEFDFARK